MGRLREIVTLVNNTPSVNITLHTLETFLAVAEDEGLTVTEYARKLQTSLNTVSRQLLDLGIRNRKKEPGWNLVEPTRDPMNLRSKPYRLTPKGRALASKIADIMVR
jgi:DNA-binding MarR family transcriptional regulator